MDQNLQIFFFATYVTFTFSVLLFGALVFRQLIDNIEVRKLRMGEDRDAFVDGKAAVCIGFASLSLFPTAIFCYGILPATIYIYALPQIVFVQILQLALRVVFQRTQVKTKGLVVRSVLFDRVHVIPFQQILVVRFIPSFFWVNVRVALPTNEVGFRILTFSAPSLDRLFSAACTAPVLWLQKGADESRRIPPNHA